MNDSTHSTDDESTDIPTDGHGRPIETTVCPTCDSADIRVHSASTINHDGRPPRYKCAACGARFDERATRARQSSTAPNAGTHAAALHEMDPEDLVTDGGQPTGNSAGDSERPKNSCICDGVTVYRRQVAEDGSSWRECAFCGGLVA